jgi:hypothetical protein
VLHSFSKEYIVEDLIAYMKKKGALAWYAKTLTYDSQ